MLEKRGAERPVDPSPRKTLVVRSKLHCLKFNPGRSSNQTRRHTGYCGDTLCNDVSHCRTVNSFFVSPTRLAGVTPIDEIGRRGE